MTPPEQAGKCALKPRLSLSPGSLCDFRHITPLGFSIFSEMDTVTVVVGALLACPYPHPLQTHKLLTLTMVFVKYLSSNWCASGHVSDWLQTTRQDLCQNWHKNWGFLTHTVFQQLPYLVSLILGEKSQVVRRTDSELGVLVSLSLRLVPRTAHWILWLVISTFPGNLMSI